MRVYLKSAINGRVESHVHTFGSRITHSGTYRIELTNKRI